MAEIVRQDDSPPAAEVLKNAVFSPADATALGLTASLTPDAAHAGSFILALGMDMQNLSLAAKNLLTDFLCLSFSSCRKSSDR